MRSLEGLRNDLAELEIRRLRKELDCWHSTTRTKVESDEFKDSLIKFYCREDPNNQYNIMCMLTNESYPRKYVRASHIVKRCTEGELMHYFGVDANIDHPRNGLLLLESIERLFDKKDLCFLYDPTNQQIKAKLLNTTLWDVEMKAEDKSSFGRTYGSVDSLVLHLPEGHFPYRRILSFHAKLALSRALARGWISDDVQFESYFNMSDHGIPEPLGIANLTWQEIHRNVHQI